MSVPKPGFDPAWLARSALLIVDMNRSHLDHSDEIVAALQPASAA